MPLAFLAGCYQEFPDAPYSISVAPVDSPNRASSVSGILNASQIRVDFWSIRFPAEWITEFSPEYICASNQSIEAIRKAIDRELGKYDNVKLETILRVVYVATAYTFKGLSYSGTNSVSEQSVYIIDRSLLSNDEMDPYRGMLHHEISSLLFHAHPEIFDHERWLSLAPMGFQYCFDDSTYMNILAGKTDLLGCESTYEHGFVCEYGMNSMEDDVNTFAQFLMARPQRTQSLRHDNRRLDEKFKIVESMLAWLGVRQGSQ
jgi:hypothetical protein